MDVAKELSKSLPDRVVIAKVRGSPHTLVLMMKPAQL